MLELESKGITSLPVILILCIFLAIAVTGIGLKGLSRAKSIRKNQKTMHSFHKLIETSNRVAFGEVGMKKKIRLKLKNSEILVNKKRIQLQNGEEIIKIEHLPLKLVKNEKENYILKSGIYLLSLSRNIDKKNETEQQLVLELSEL